MAKVENTRVTVSLDAESKRVFKNLTRAIDRLASRKWDGGSGVKRLSEPAEDPALGGDNESHSHDGQPKAPYWIDASFHPTSGDVGKYNALR